MPYNIDAEVRSIFERILKEYELTDVLCLDFIKTLLVQLFIIISRLDLKSLNTEATCYKYNLIRKFLKLTESNVGLLKLPKEYAELLFITPSRLNTLCNEYLGKSTGEIIRDRLILEAKRLILNPELSLLEISYRLNFNDNSYFSKFFKKYTGITPEEFRNSSRDVA